MKVLLKSKNGFSLVEMVIAIALFTIISTAVLSALVSSQQTTIRDYENKPKYEETVGRMDEMLSGDTSGVTGEDADVSVQFPAGTSTNVPSKIIRDTDLKNVAIIKAK